jgi:hypothetical protein
VRRLRHDQCAGRERPARLDFESNIVSIVSNLPGDPNGLFYVITADYVVHTITPAGVVGGTTWTLPAFDPNQRLSVAVDREGAILYYAVRLQQGQPIQRYDLVNDAPLSDLVAGFGSEFIVGHGYVARDGSILFPFQLGDHSGSRVRRLSAAGFVIKVYEYEPIPEVITNLHWADDDPGSFWTRSTQVGIPEQTVLQRRLLSTGDTLNLPVVANNIVSEQGSVNNEPFGLSLLGWFLKANEGLLVSDNTADFPVALVSTLDGSRSWLNLPAGNIQQLNEAAIIAPFAPPPPVIANPLQQWQLHRADVKPRAEETA